MKIIKFCAIVLTLTLIVISIFYIKLIEPRNIHKFEGNYNIPIKFKSKNMEFFKDEILNLSINVNMNFYDEYYYNFTNIKEKMLFKENFLEITFPRRFEKNPSLLSNIFIGIKHKKNSINEDVFYAFFIEWVNNKNNHEQYYKNWIENNTNNDTVITSINSSEFYRVFKNFKGKYIFKRIEEISIDCQYPIMNLFFFNRIKISGYNKNYSLFFLPVVDSLGNVRGFIK